LQLLSEWNLGEWQASVMPVIWAARELLMPAYAFEIRWNKGEKTSWTYFPTDGQARDFARILIQNLKNGWAIILGLPRWS
jgi:hypothetical protein